MSQVNKLNPQIDTKGLIDTKNQLEKEIKVCAKAIENISETLNILGVEDKQMPKTTPPKSNKTQSSYVPIKDTIVEVLKKEPHTLDEIVNIAKKDKKVDLKKGSVSSTLSRLKSSKEVIFHNDSGKFELKKKAA